MKGKLKLLFVSLALLMLHGEVARAQSFEDKTKSVTIISDERLASAFAAEKACDGLHQVTTFGGASDWVLSLVIHNRSTQVSLMNSSSEPHQYVLLGTNIKKGVQKACNIVNGRAKAKWMVVP
jgi:hypothetical protein